MGKYSDSEDEKKKRKKKKKKRSRSRSVSSLDSKYSSKHKKSKKSKHKKKSRSRSRSGSVKRARGRRSRSGSYSRRSRSRSKERYRSRSRSRGKRSRSRSYPLRSRSRSRERYLGRRRSRSLSRSRLHYSRSRSRGRYSRSRSRGRYSRSRSRSRDRYIDRSRRRSSSRSPERSRYNSRRSRSAERTARYSSRSPSRVKVKSEDSDPCLSVPGFSEMTPAEQAKVRMQMALKAAAAADEKLKEQKLLSIDKREDKTFEEQLKFSSAVSEIESSGFIAASFKSSRSDKKDTAEKTEEFLFGTAAEFKPDLAPKHAFVIEDPDNLAHPNLYVDPEEKLERWIQKLTAMRKRKLEGEAFATNFLV